MKQHSKLFAWATLIFLTGVSVQAAHQSHGGWSRFVMTVAVAGIAWIKALVVIHAYLESPKAGRRFHRIIMCFAMLAPLALLVSGIKEFAV